MPSHRTRVGSDELPALLDRVRDALAVARAEVDALNVFPVPDGDTGTNMLTTVQVSLDEVAAAGDDADGAALAEAAGRGALRGAAGNSGVILSQVLRAFVEPFADGRSLTLDLLAPVLGRARDLAYEAVADPLPGTILSAIDAAAGTAGSIEELPPGLTLVDAMRLVAAAVGDAVAATREVLEANAAAGVVDAGARGFEVVLDGILAYLEGRTFEAVVPPPIRRGEGRVVARESGSLEYRWEVQYLLEAPDAVVDGLRRDLQALGDSVVVVGCGDLVNVHVHTNDVDGVQDAGRALGRITRTTITEFADQVGDHLAERDDRGAADAPERPVGFLAVVPGPGVRELVEAAGAIAVDGTSGALPSVATILNAVGEVRAREVVLLPGHPNVVPTMRQASAVSVAEGGRTLHVVEDARSVPAVLAVLAVAPHDELDLDVCTDAAQHVHAGEVVAAVRDADTPLGRVGEGQWLAVVEGVVIAACDDVLDALGTVVDTCVTGTIELVTLVAGAEVDDDERAAARDRVDKLAPDVEVELVDGRQAPARWIVGAE